MSVVFPVQFRIREEEFCDAYRSALGVSDIPQIRMRINGVAATRLAGARKLGPNLGVTLGVSIRRSMAGHWPMLDISPTAKRLDDEQLIAAVRLVRDAFSDVLYEEAYS